MKNNILKQKQIRLAPHDLSILTFKYSDVNGHLKCVLDKGFHYQNKSRNAQYDFPNSSEMKISRYTNKKI